MIFEKKKIGLVEYELPTPIDTMKLYAKCNVGENIIDNPNPNTDNALLLSARILENIDKYITKVDVTIGKTKITNYDDLVSNRLAMDFMIEFALHYYAELNNVPKASKKKG